ncbi:MAG: sigma-54-dependent Fis family transcriptional regulator [Minicystis sp.]
MAKVGAPRAGAVDETAKERDLYKRLLDLGTQEEIEPFLEEALALVVDISGARRGYVEIVDPDAADQPSFGLAHGCSEGELTEIRKVFSHGIIAEAIATGETISTLSALDDPRFFELRSVQVNQIEAVLCTPIGKAPPMGVIYLQDRALPGPFSESDQARIETFARHLATFADRLLTKRRRRDERDPTLEHRRKLRADGVIGRSAALAHVLRQIALVAPLDIDVLLFGPCGTGKTQIARALHESSPRASHPFIELNCAVPNTDLLAADLFGHLRGAFTGADRDRLGKVAAAEHGTLFLDEIGELGLEAQAKLLQFLQSKEFTPVGATRPVQADVRVVAATNVDLKAAMAQKRFREDLYYRLAVMPIRVPSLAERRVDIAALAAHFCERMAATSRLPRMTLSLSALRALEAADWPGNVRDLENTVKRAAIFAAGDGATQIERRHIFPEDAPPGPDPDDGPTPALSLQDAMRRFQRGYVLRVLQETGWNVTETASRLEISRSHVYNLIHAHDLRPDPER